MKSLFIILFQFTLVFIVKAQSKIYKDKELSFDSLLIIKGNQSKGKPFTKFQFSNNKGIVNNRILVNRVTYMNFWFKACPPCIAEMQALNELYTSLKGNPSFQFISFTFETDAVIAQMKKKYHIEYPIYSIPKNECYRLNQDNGFPTSIVVNKNGRISFLLSGYTTDPVLARSVLFNKIRPEIIKLL